MTETDYELKPQRASLFLGMAIAWFFVGVAALLANFSIHALEFTWWVWLFGAALMFAASYLAYRNERKPIAEAGV